MNPYPYPYPSNPLPSPSGQTNDPSLRTQQSPPQEQHPSTYAYQPVHAALPSYPTGTVPYHVAPTPPSYGMHDPSLSQNNPATYQSSIPGSLAPSHAPLLMAQTTKPFPPQNPSLGVHPPAGLTQSIPQPSLPNLPTQARAAFPNLSQCSGSNLSPPPPGPTATFPGSISAPSAANNLQQPYPTPMQPSMARTVEATQYFGESAPQPTSISQPVATPGGVARPSGEVLAQPSIAQSTGLFSYPSGTTYPTAMASITPVPSSGYSTPNVAPPAPGHTFVQQAQPNTAGFASQPSVSTVPPQPTVRTNIGVPETTVQKLAPSQDPFSTLSSYSKPITQPQAPSTGIEHLFGDVQLSPKVPSTRQVDSTTKALQSGRTPDTSFESAPDLVFKAPTSAAEFPKHETAHFVEPKSKIIESPNKNKMDHLFFASESASLSAGPSAIRSHQLHRPPDPQKHSIGESPKASGDGMASVGPNSLPLVSKSDQSPSIVPPLSFDHTASISSTIRDNDVSPGDPTINKRSSETSAEFWSDDFAPKTKDASSTTPLSSLYSIPGVDKSKLENGSLVTSGAEARLSDFLSGSKNVINSPERADAPSSTMKSSEDASTAYLAARTSSTPDRVRDALSSDEPEKRAQGPVGTEFQNHTGASGSQDIFQTLNPTFAALPTSQQNTTPLNVTSKPMTLPVQTFSTTPVSTSQPSSKIGSSTHNSLANTPVASPLESTSYLNNQSHQVANTLSRHTMERESTYPSIAHVGYPNITHPPVHQIASPGGASGLTTPQNLTPASAPFQATPQVDLPQTTPSWQTSAPTGTHFSAPPQISASTNTPSFSNLSQPTPSITAHPPHPMPPSHQPDTPIPQPHPTTHQPYPNPPTPQYPPEILSSLPPNAPLPSSSPSSTSALPTSPTSRPPSTSRRIDPTQVPNPSRDLLPSNGTRAFYRTAAADTLPPPAGSSSLTQDDGNASPRYVRLSCYRAPLERKVLEGAQLPWAAVLTPLAPPGPGEGPVPVVLPVPGHGPVRCRRCRAYVSCHSTFTEQGRRWGCTYCRIDNEVPQGYGCGLDPATGRRMDYGTRAEITVGSVEYNVEGLSDYALRRGQSEGVVGVGKTAPAATYPLHVVFVLDISCGVGDATSGYLGAMVEALTQALRVAAQTSPEVYVGFVTFASSVHFYDFRVMRTDATSRRAAQVCMNEPDNPFVPLPFNQLCWLSLEREIDVALRFVQDLPVYAAHCTERGSALGAAVRCAQLILHDTGGRVIVSTTQGCNTGLGALTPREENKLIGVNNDREAFLPREGFWTTIATEAAKRQISFDWINFSSSFVELPTLSQLSHLSSGNILEMSHFVPSRDSSRLKHELTEILAQPSAHGAILRVRVSNGTRVASYSGHYLSQDAKDMDLAALYPNQSFLVEFEHEGRLESPTEWYLQAALLYTTPRGDRRLRVHSLRVPVVAQIPELFKGCDLEATLACYLHRSLRAVVAKGLTKAREAMNQQVTEMLFSYRRYCSSSQHAGQLILPENLKLLPLFLYLSLKTFALRQPSQTDVRVDDRARDLHRLLALPPSQLLLYLYPRTYDLTNLLSTPSVGTFPLLSSPDFADNSVPPSPFANCVMPPWTQLYAERIRSDGVYLCDDLAFGKTYLWVGNQVTSECLQQLFGISVLPSSETITDAWMLREEVNPRLRAAWNEIRATRGNILPRLELIREGVDSLESLWWQRMVEDRNCGETSYVDFLCLLHATIREKMIMA